MLVSPNRKISRSQMIGINLIKICQAIISVRVILPNKEKISISINNANNNNNSSNNINNNDNYNED